MSQFPFFSIDYSHYIPHKNPLLASVNEVQEGD